MEKLHQLLKQSKKMCDTLRSFDNLHPYTVIQLGKLEVAIKEMEIALKEI